MKYCYYMTQRPPMPGAQPRDGLVEIQDIDPSQQTPGIGRAYARLTYDRPLSDNEIRGYELIPDTDTLRHNKEWFMGYTIQFNPILNLWDIYDGTCLMASTATLDEAKAGISEL